MKQKMNLAQFSLYVVWLGLIVLACFAAAGARAQTGQPVTPLLDEIIVNPASGRATAYFGYTNSSSSAVTLNIGEPANFFFPSPQNRGQLSRFIPGTHRYAFAVVWVYADEPQITWILNGTSVVANTATVTPQEPTTVFTYQGRLVDNNAAASGAFDLEFKLFNAGGIQIGPAQVKDNVPVTSGIFTVQLEAAVFGSNAFNGGDRTLEIGVRRGTETGAFTPLTPRQPITSAPYAIRSLNSATADTAANALTLGNVAANQYLTGQVVRSVNGLNNNVTLAAGANVTITPSGSTLTIASTGAGGSGAFSWEEITGASVQAQSNRGYIANNNAAQVVVTLPASPGVGDVVRISGAGSRGWKIAQNAGQFIVLGTITEDFPAVWTPRETVRDWKSVASSSDGTKLVAGVDGGQIYTAAMVTLTSVTTTGASGILTGGQNTAVELLYTGGGRFMTLSSKGTITAF